MMDFWLIFLALVIALFSIGRISLPDPDNSLSERSEEQLKQLQIELTANGIVGILYRAIYIIIYISYFPYNHPVAGLGISGLLIISVVFI